VTLKFKTYDLRATLESLCLRVLEHFQLPDLRLLCFFDDVDPACFVQRFGSGYRGFHMPIRGSGYFPPYISQLFFDSHGFAFDNVIYLRGIACAVQTGAVITFAHELQHFVQYGNADKVFAANALLCCHLRNFDQANKFEAWDIPYEQDAMIVSKRVAEAVIGPEAVRQHVDLQISAATAVLYWRYFQRLSSSTPFDLLAETIPLVDKYRPQLLQLRQTKVDFTESEWWRSTSLPVVEG